MNNQSHSAPEENNNKKSSGEELKDALLSSHEISQPDEKAPVGPFEHSGEVAGWTAAEEQQEKSGEGGQQQTGSEAKE